MYLKQHVALMKRLSMRITVSTHAVDAVCCAAYVPWQTTHNRELQMDRLAKEVCT
jgi:hypothetical protein